jgi:hypothetical protein
MQNRPDHSTLLDAIASFLMADVAPKLEADKALQFRMLIAANLATVVAGELRTHSTRLSAERARLQKLLESRSDDLEGMNRQLSVSLRKNELSPDQLTRALDHLLATARETLEVTNPRFDLSDDV